MGVDLASDDAARRAELERFLRSVERRALRMASFAVGNVDDALELLQEGMLVFVRRYQTHPQSDWPALFWRVLDSRIHDHHRRQTVRLRWRVFFGRSRDSETAPDPLEQLPEDRPGPLQQLAGAQSSAALESALRRLPDRQRQAFLLRLWEGLSVADTALAMGCSQGSVKTHLHRALDALRGYLEAHR